MKLAEPHVLYFFLLMPLMVALLVSLAHLRNRRLSRLMDPSLETGLVRHFDKRRYIVKNIVLCLGLATLILALARPQWGFEWKSVKRQGLDIFLAVDVSKSMLTADVRPNRLERTKLAVRDLIGKLNGDRIGLIAFSGDAFLVCPLTVDYGGFLLSLDDLSINTIPRGGTNIGRAIQEAMKGYTDVPTKFKTLVIVTDGEEEEGDALEWAKVAAQKGIKIYTVGIGTKEGELIRAPDETGQMSFLKDANGNVVKSRLNEKLLNAIAAATGGAYVRAGGAQSGLAYLYDADLSKLERRDIESDMEKKYNDRYQWFVGAALIFLILEFYISLRRSEG